MSSEPDRSLRERFFQLYDQALDDQPEQALTHPLFFELSNLLEDYKILEELAHGGMKVIHRALHLKSQRMVAMARLHPETPEELYDPFIREARLTAHLDHPNIIKVYDLGIDRDGRPYFTMELKPGRTVKDLLQKRSHDLNKRLTLFLRVCDAIAYAHSRNTLHLDIKPDNIQVGDFGEVLVCDWGLGKILNDDLDDIHSELLHPDLLNHMTMGGEIKGTPGFMAPEQYRAEEKSYATDIYALGALLRSLILQQMPDNHDLQTMKDLTLKGHWVKLSKLETDLPIGLEAIVEKAMALEPGSRYPGVVELKRDIERVMEHHSPSTYSSNPIHEGRLFYRRHRRVCQISLVAFASLAITIALFTYRLNQERILAEQLSKSLSIEKEQLSHLSEKLIHTYLKNSRLFSDHFIFENPIESVANGLSLLDEVHKALPDHPWATMQKGYLNFIRLDFEQAGHYLNIHAGSCEDLRDLAENFQHDPDFNTDRPAPDAILRLLEKIGAGKRGPLKYKILSHYSERHHSPVGIETCIEAMIRHANPEWLGTFHYDRENQRLQLSGKGLNQLSERNARQPALALLPIRSLSIDSPTYHAIDELEGLQGLQELHLNPASRLQLQRFPRLPDLQKLILNTEKQILRHDISSLGPEVELIFQ